MKAQLQGSQGYSLATRTANPSDRSCYLFMINFKVAESALRYYGPSSQRLIEFLVCAASNLPSFAKIIGRSAYIDDSASKLKGAISAIPSYFR